MRRKLLALALVLVAACEGSDEVVYIDAPAIDAPVDAPAPDAPVDAPAPDAPAPDAPIIDAPIIDAPVIDAPAIDAPAIDAPAIDAPVIDAPPIDAPPIDAPAGSAALTIQQNGTGRVWLRVYANSATLGHCWFTTCTYLAPLGAAVRVEVYWLFGGVPGGWTGCTYAAGFCDTTFTGPTTINVTTNQTDGWLRFRAFDTVAIAAATTPGGGLIVVGSRGGDMYVQRYAADGTESPPIFENLTAGDDSGRDVVCDATGAVTISALAGGGVLRHYSAAGALDWSRGISAGAPLDLDAAGNLYTYATSGELVSYTPAGVERWRRTVPTTNIPGLDVNGDRLAAGGAAYDLAGTLLWSYTLQQPSEFSARDSVMKADGTIAFLFRDGSNECAVHTVSVPSSPQPAGGFGQICQGGRMLALPSGAIAFYTENAGGTTYYGPPYAAGGFANGVEAWTVGPDGTQYIAGRELQAASAFEMTRRGRTP